METERQKKADKAMKAAVEEATKKATSEAEELKKKVAEMEKTLSEQGKSTADDAKKQQEEAYKAMKAAVEEAIKKATSEAEELNINDKAFLKARRSAINHAASNDSKKSLRQAQTQNRPEVPKKKWLEDARKRLTKPAERPPTQPRKLSDFEKLVEEGQKVKDKMKRRKNESSNNNNEEAEEAKQET